MARKKVHEEFRYAFKCICGEQEDGLTFVQPWARLERFVEYHAGDGHKPEVYCDYEARKCWFWRGHEGPCEKP